MLGKTNITAIKEGTTVTDIEEYSWKSIKVNGVNSDFVKAVYGNNMLVAITRDGTIVSTADGENWEKTRIEMEGSYELEDIIWTGSQYIMVGNRKEIVTEKIIQEGDSASVYKYHGIKVTSERLLDFLVEEDEDNIYSRYYAIVEKDEKQIIISKEYKDYPENAGVYAVFKDSNGTLKKKISKCTVSQDRICGHLNDHKVVVAKKNSGGAVYIEDNHFIGLTSSTAPNAYNKIWITSDWLSYSSIQVQNSSTQERAFSVFECKDSLFYYKDDYHTLLKILNENSQTTVSQNVAFLFLDAIYFNKCEILVNGHNMLVIRSGENIADKTLEDLIEITYDFEIRFIEKAFSGLYIFGTEGNILVSSDEIKNEEAIAVKTMSATKALHDAKVYADEKYAVLEARIIELEKRS
ncbi:MAG: hypothetical protein HDP34_04365 [Clostridia bacterium]|nr:hypothetical protein [Clostridia bacterium]